MKPKSIFPVNSTYLILITLILFCVITRFYKLGTWNFWYDEIYTVQHAFTVSFSNFKPIYYLLSRASFELFGISEWSARLFSALSGIVIIPLFYFSIKKITDVTTALVTSAFVAFSSWHLFHSQTARFYALAFLLGGLSAFMFYYGLQTKKYKYIGISLFLALLGTLTHTTVVFIFPAMFLFMFTSKFLEGRKKTIIALLLVTLIGCLFLPFAIKLMKSWAGLGHDWGYSLPHLVMAIISNVGIPIITIAGITLIVLIYERNKIGYFLLCYTLFPLVCISLIGLFSNVRQDYIFSTIPGYFLLAGIGCARIYNTLKDKQLILGIGFICVMMTSTAPSFISHYSDGNRHGIKDPSQYIEDNKGDADVFLCNSPGLINYYFNVDAKYLSLEHLNLYKGQMKNIWILVSYNRKGMSDMKDEIKEWIYKNCRMVKEYIPTRFDYIDNTVRIFQYDAH